ncbi:aldo/keto reductase [Streptomyces reniochalinae]|uniref:aldo/keto reductase n=1 Tax=Streptomyces reniochalinae TaxID=2250578 RepID=UPI001C68EC09|nr:aldo/keto reductase [Streptomyces reniochalinae]
MAGLDADAYRRFFDIAFDAGVNLVDTANMYSCGQAEEITAQALAGRRDALILTSKVRMPLDDIAQRYGVSVPRVVLAWLLGRPGVTGVVLGARSEAHLQDNLAAAELRLTDEGQEAITRVSQLPAYYPWWHRALNAGDRPDPAEQPYLAEFQRYALPGD